MSTMTAEKLTVGQEVILIDPRRWRGEAPVIRDAGLVISAGRRYATAEINGLTYEFDMSSGYQRGDTNANGYRIITPAQADLEKREREAEAYLKTQGLERSLGRGCLTAEQIIAVADLVRSFTTEESGHA